eukprot:scaffold621436_cov90-Attheya_sp.AAC.3
MSEQENEQVKNNSVVVERMRGLLGKELHCTLSDGRVARGTFVCIDRLSNIILQNVVEQRPLTTTTTTSSISSGSDANTSNNNIVYTERHLSQALVPGKHLRHVQIRTKCLEGELPLASSFVQEPATIVITQE